MPGRRERKGMGWKSMRYHVALYHIAQPLVFLGKFLLAFILLQDYQVTLDLYPNSFIKVGTISSLYFVFKLGTYFIRYFINWLYPMQDVNFHPPFLPNYGLLCYSN